MYEKFLIFKIPLKLGNRKRNYDQVGFLFFYLVCVCFCWETVGMFGWKYLLCSKMFKGTLCFTSVNTFQQLYPSSVSREMQSQNSFQNRFEVHFLIHFHLSTYIVLNPLQVFFPVLSQMCIKAFQWLFCSSELFLGDSSLYFQILASIQYSHVYSIVSSSVVWCLYLFMIFTFT